MGWPNPKGDDTQVVDALTGLASKVSGRCDCNHYSLARGFSQASKVVARSLLAASVAVVQFFCL